jgi:hypothetical protein
MDFDPIVAAECEDCGTTMVIDPSFINVFKLEDEFLAITLCQHCERPILAYIPLELAEELELKQVRILSWIEENNE